MLEDLTLTQLRKIIRDYNLHTSIKIKGGISKASKDDLIKHIHMHMTLDNGELVIKPHFEPVMLPVSAAKKKLNLAIRNKHFDKIDAEKMRIIAEKKEKEKQEKMDAIKHKKDMKNFINFDVDAEMAALKKLNSQLKTREKLASKLTGNYKLQEKHFERPTVNIGKRILKEDAQLKKLMNTIENDEPKNKKDVAKLLSYVDITRRTMPSVKVSEAPKDHKRPDFKPTYKNVLKKGELVNEPFIFEQYYKEPVKKLSASDFARHKQNFGETALKKEASKLKLADFARTKNKFVESAVDKTKMNDIKKWIAKETDKYNYRDIKDLEPQTRQPWTYDELVEYKRKLNLLKRQMKKQK